MNVGHGDGSLNVDLGESTGHVKSPAPAGLVETLPQLDSTKRSITQPLPPAVARPRWEARYAPKVAVADLTVMAVSLGLHTWWSLPAGGGLPDRAGPGPDGLVLMAWS